MDKSKLVFSVCNPICFHFNFLIGHIEKPEFSYLEKHVLEVKYKISNNTYLFVCWSCNRSATAIEKIAKCGNNKICPHYGEVQHNCQSKGHYKICLINWVGIDIYFQGYVFQRDSKNVTRTSEVATYLSSETSMFVVIGFIIIIIIIIMFGSSNCYTVPVMILLFINPLLSAVVLNATQLLSMLTSLLYLISIIVLLLVHLTLCKLTLFSTISSLARSPRPVTNLIILPKKTDLILQWTPSEKYTASAIHHQLVSCQPVQDKDAKVDIINILSDKIIKEQAPPS